MALAMPEFFGWTKKYKVESEAQKLHFQLLKARALAISKNNNVIVTFTNSGTHGYEVHNDTNGNGSKDSDETVSNVVLQNNIVFGFNAGVADVDGNSLTSGVSLGGDNKITFTPRGMASGSGSLYLIPAEDVGVKNDLMRAVSILQSTGGLELLKYSATGAPGPWA